MTLHELQQIVDRLAEQWGIAPPTITVDSSVNGQIGRVTKLRGRTTMSFEPVVLSWPVDQAELAVGHELAHLVHPPVPTANLDGWPRFLVLMAAIMGLATVFSALWPLVVAISFAVGLVSGGLLAQWVFLARIQRRHELFADAYAAKRLGPERVATYLNDRVRSREPEPVSRVCVIRWLGRAVATHPSVPKRVEAVRCLAASSSR